MEGVKRRSSGTKGKGLLITFSNELSLGHVVQALFVVVPAIVFWVRLEGRVSSQGESVMKLVLQYEKLDETMNLLARNQAVLTALFEQHQRKEQTQ